MNRSCLGQIFSVFLIVALIVGLVAAGTAEAMNRQLTVLYPGITLNVDGREVLPRDADGAVVEPFAVGGTTYLPIRAVANALGKEIRWDGDTNTIYLTDGSGSGTAQAGQSGSAHPGQRGEKAITVVYLGIKLKVNGTDFTPRDANGAVVEPFAYNQTTYLPVRAVSQAFGMNVAWDGETKTIFLSHGASGILTVSVLDVGQGDAIYIALPNGESMLIDAGERSRGDDVVQYVKARGDQTIEYLVGTHPHADHIGGMEQVLDNLDIGAVFLPNAETDTRTFEDFLLALSQKGLKIRTAKAGVTILNDEGLNIQVVAPQDKVYGDLNNYSAVIRLTYRNTVFLFMGDAEALSEKEITADVDADVLKVGHHGSSSSTSQAFLNRVSPRYAVISVGAGNSYGHPSQTVLDRLTAAGVTVYRTDLDGTVVFTSDGTQITAPAA